MNKDIKHVPYGNCIMFFLNENEIFNSIGKFQLNRQQNKRLL